MSSSAGGENADDPGSLSRLLPALEKRDPAVLNEIARRFFPRLASLARRTLARLPRVPADGEDVAQSALASFCQLLERRCDLSLSDRDDLWKLLSTIAIRKALKKSRQQRTAKRGGGRVVTESALSQTEGALDQLISIESPAEFDVCCSELLETLSVDDRTAVLLRLRGYSTAEIAGELNTHQRTVQRQLESVRQRWETLVTPDD